MILLWIGVSILAAWQLPSLQTDFEFENLFPSRDPDVIFYRKHLEEFGYDNDYLLLILNRQQGVFHRDFLQRTQALAEDLRRSEAVKLVMTPTDIQLPFKSPLGMFPVPLIHLAEPEKYGGDSARMVNHPLFSRFVSKNGQSLLLQIRHEHLPADAGSPLLQDIIHQLTNHGFDDYHLLGKVRAQHTFTRLIQNDFILFLIAGLVIGFALLYLIFRSLRMALLPYLAGVTTLIWLLGLLSALELKLSLLGALLPPVILFVSTSNVVHLLNAFSHFQGKEKSIRLTKTFHKVMIPSLITAVTTAVGFFSLITINTKPIIILGCAAGAGVLLAYLITFLFLPVLLISTGNGRKQVVNFDPRKLTLMIVRKEKVIVSLALLVIFISIAGMFRLENDSYLLKDLPASEPVVADFRAADRLFGGSKPWEMAIWPADSTTTLWDPDVMNEMDRLDHILAEEYPMEHRWSPLTVMKLSNQLIENGNSERYCLPSSTKWQDALDHIKRSGMTENLIPLIDERGARGRVIGYIPEYGSKNTALRNNLVLRSLEKEINKDILKYRLTGTTYLIDKSNQMLSQNLLWGLLWAVGLVSLILGLYFRSWSILFVSLIPNLIPLLVAAGVMGWLEIPLQMTTAILFVIAFGIAVDDTIHFIATYRQNGKGKIWSAIHTFRIAGKAIVITTFILIAGFGIFLFSSFGATFLLGLFLILTLGFALLADLFILPVLLLKLNIR